MAMAPALTLCGLVCAQPAAAPLILENSHIRVSFDPAIGSLREVVHKPAGLSLVEPEAANLAVAIELPETGWQDRPREFAWERVGGGDSQALRLEWRFEHGILVTATAELDDSASEVLFRPSVEVRSRAVVRKLAYPLISGVRRLSEAGADALLWPLAGGLLLTDPVGWVRGLPGEDVRGFPSTVYPNGFDGAPVPVSAYGVEGAGGFYLLALDPHATAKSLTFGALPESDTVIWGMSHFSWDHRPGRGLPLDYPVALGVLPNGRWEDAALRYRDRVAGDGAYIAGPVAETARWLAGEVGFSTFGISASADQSAWLRAFHSVADVPVLHVLGHDWRRAPPPGAWGAADGPTLDWALSQWFPTQVHPANLEAVKACGDRLALFEFDTFANSAAEYALHGVQPALPFPYLCPAERYTRDFHAARDATAVRETNADAMYGDISAANGPMGCFHPGHEHPPGEGRWLFEAYRSMFAETAEACREARGAPVPRGTEVISEAVLPTVAFYQARAWGQPAASFEGEGLVPLLLERRMEFVPLFDFIYHEWGPVRMDGWLKLAREAGELFYWVAARCALWGALPQCNYEFSPLERWPGTAEDPLQLAYHFRIIRDPDYTFDVDPGKLAFLREIALARTGFAREFLALGRMLPAPRIQSELVALSYRHYNCFGPRHEQGRRGEHLVAAVVAQAWRAPGGDVGIVLCNVDGQRSHDVQLRLDLAEHGLPNGASLRVETARGVTAPEPVEGPALDRTLSLEPRRILLLRLSAR